MNDPIVCGTPSSSTSKSACGEVAHRLPAPVAHDDVDQDGGDAFFDRAGGALRLLGAAGAR